MSDAETLLRLDAAVESIAQNAGAGVQKAELENGLWVISIEPIGDEQGTWAVTGSGPTEAVALSRLIANAKAEGLA